LLSFEVCNKTLHTVCYGGLSPPAKTAQISGLGGFDARVKEPVEQFAVEVPPRKAPAELGEVALKVLRGHAVVNAPDCPLRVGYQYVDPRQLARRALGVVDDLRLVGVPGKGEVVSEETVGHHGRAGLYHLFAGPFQFND
jgi:hypothetical protein